MDAAEQGRLIAAEVLAKADEQSEKRVVAAVEAVMTNVVLHVGMAEKTLLAEINTVKTGFRWQLISALVGGQTVAGVAAAYLSGNGARVEQVAAAILPWL